MRQARLFPIAFALFLAAGSVSALGQEPAPPGPYKSIKVTLPPRQSDASLDVFRKELGDIATKKDRAALAGKVLAKGFFWQREDSNDADPKKSGIDNLAAALGLDAPDGSGWQALANYAADTTATPLPEMKGALCSPAMPTFDEAQMEKLAQATRTDPAEWVYPTSEGVEVRAKAEPAAAVVEKLATVMVRVLPDENATGDWVKVVTPSGKIGYLSANVIAPVGSDQLCYQKEGGSWKIAGYVGAGTGQE